MSGTLTVTKATLIITANNTAKTYGAVNPTLTVTYTGFAGSDNSASLTTQPTITTTALTSSPAGNYPITAGGAAAANYSISYVAGTLTVNKAVLTITGNNVTKVYATANPALGITYSGFVNGDTNAALTVQPVVTTTSVTGSPVGTYPVTASGAVSSNYTISYVAGTLTITPATLTITAVNATKVYGSGNPSFSVTYAGFVNGDTNTSLSTQPTITSTAVIGSSVGTYPITPSGAVSANYTINYVSGTLTVSKAALTISANNVSRAYGAANPILTATYSGFVNGDTNTSLGTQPTITTTAVASSPLGTYPITVSGAAASNYNIGYSAGTLTVVPASLVITANNQTKVINTANPALTITYSGFVNGDTNTSLGTQPTITTTAVASSPLGTYPITVSGAAASNYNIGYSAGTLTVVPASLVITANNQTKVINTANPALTITYSGFVNGDTNTSLTTQPSISTTATISSGVGTYPITVSGAASPKYAITYVQGTLTVTASTNANLVGLSVSSGVLSPVFSQALTAYSVSVANSVTSISVTPTTADPGAIVTVNGTSVQSGIASNNIPLTVGSNTISTTVTAQDGVTQINYTITVTRAASSNASLSNLSISNGSITPSFGPAAYKYFTVVDYAINQITVTPTLADATASILVNGQVVPNSTPSNLINLQLGDNVIAVVITAQDGITQLTYTITVHRTDPASVYATNILSPNGDGKNDYWVVKDILSYPNNTVTVYDRAGRIVFSKHTYTNDWDGTFKGAPLAEGTYYYLINLGIDEGTVLKGFITIVRNR